MIRPRRISRLVLLTVLSAVLGSLSPVPSQPVASAINLTQTYSSGDLILPIPAPGPA